MYCTIQLPGAQDIAKYLHCTPGGQDKAKLHSCLVPRILPSMPSAQDTAKFAQLPGAQDIAKNLYTVNRIKLSNTTVLYRGYCQVLSEARILPLLTS
jgi:hypothetical protein